MGLDQIQCPRVVGVREIIAVAKYLFQTEVARQVGARAVILLDGAIDQKTYEPEWELFNS